MSHVDLSLSFFIITQKKRWYHLTDSKNKTGQDYLNAGAARNTFHLKLAAISTIIIITEAKDGKINTNSQQNVNLRRKTQ